MAKLLVSVRSVAEAHDALCGGAAIIDIKEPNLGPLGRAPGTTWRAIRAEMPVHIPVSVALGELADLDFTSIRSEDFTGIAFRKVGPAGMGRAWAVRWNEVRRLGPDGIGWVAVAYADWERADAPSVDDVIAVALAAEDCPGVLIDTWDKSLGCPIVASDLWGSRINRVQDSGRFVALAGRLDLAAIRRLGGLAPDLFAVRGAACSGNHRDGRVDRDLVAELVEAAGATSSQKEVR